MRKKVFQTLLVLSVALIATIIIAVSTKVSFQILVDNITWMSIVLVTCMIIDDPIYLLLNNRKLLMNKPYLFGIGMYLFSTVLFEVSYFTNDAILEMVFLILSALTLVGALVYTYKQYKNPVFTCIEKQRYLVAILRDKIKNGMTEELCKIELSHVLKFRLEGDTIEGNIDIIRPFCNDNGSLYTLSSMIQANKDEKFDAKIVNTTAYINKLVEQIKFNQD